MRLVFGLIVLAEVALVSSSWAVTAKWRGGAMGPPTLNIGNKFVERFKDVTNSKKDPIVARHDIAIPQPPSMITLYVTDPGSSSSASRKHTTRLRDIYAQLGSTLLKLDLNNHDGNRAENVEEGLKEALNRHKAWLKGGRATKSEFKLLHHELNKEKKEEIKEEILFHAYQRDSDGATVLLFPHQHQSGGIVIRSIGSNDLLKFHDIGIKGLENMVAGNMQFYEVVEQ